MDNQFGYVYFLQIVGYPVFKIGCTNNPARRMKTLQAKYQRFDIRYAALISSNHYERAEFNTQQQYRNFRIVGEWFCFPQDIIESIQSIGLDGFDEKGNEA